MTGLDTLGEKMDSMGELFSGLQMHLKTTESIIDAATLQLSGISPPAIAPGIIKTDCLNLR
jgi:hypothetical protein